MRPVKNNIFIIIFLTLILVLSIASSNASNVQGEPHEQNNIIPFISVFIQLAGLSPDDALNLTGIADNSFYQEPFTLKNDTSKIAVEITDNYTRISNAENITIRAVKLKEKPFRLKDPSFKVFMYLDIHKDTPSSSGATIRILNKWHRTDLIIYHYKDDDWQPLQTVINGDFLEAGTDSFSVFAVGAPGGINIRLLADTLILSDDNVTVGGSAYYNNSTPAAGIRIEIKPSWEESLITTTDQQGNFLQSVTGPSAPGNYSLQVNASSSILRGENSTTIQVTNTTLYRVNSSASISNTTVADPYSNISFSFPADAVPEVSRISLGLSSVSNLNVKINNVTIYNASTNSINLNITGYLAPQNDINITTSSHVNLTYNITLDFHTTKNAQVTGYTGYYSAELNVTNGMSYDWKNSSVIYHLPEGAFGVSVWENNSNITGSAIISRNLARIKNSGIGTIYNNSIRNFRINYSLMQLILNITTTPEELGEGEQVVITPFAYFNNTLIDSGIRMIIYRDSVPVYNTNVTSGTPFVYSNTLAGIYNITASAFSNVDGVERTGSSRTFIHIKDLLLYANADPALQGRQIKVTGRAYYTNNTGYEGRINISTGNESYYTISNTEGYFSSLIPGRTAGTYTISLNASSGDSIAYANTNAYVSENYFYLIKGYLPVVSTDVTLAPDATLWINQTNITSASLYLYCKTAIHLLYNPLPIAHKAIPTGLNSNISGTFKLPLYPYDYLEILSAYLNTTAEDPVNYLEDLAFNLTIDGREINSSVVPYGVPYFTQSDNIKGFIPSFLNPGNTQTVKVFNKNTGSSQQYYFTEEIYVDYIGHISSPCDLFINTNNNFTYANIGNFTDATVDITGFRAASNMVRLNNCRRTSIIGYDLTLQKQYSGSTSHSVVEGMSRYNITDTAVFAPGTNLTNVTVIIPISENAEDVQVFVNGTNVTESAIIGEDMELFLSEVNSARIINITYWSPIPDITPSVNNSQFNRGDTVQIRADVTYQGENVSDATVYANVTKADAIVGNVTLNYTSGSTYIADYTISSGASLGSYNVTVWAYNATMAHDSENTSFKIRDLNVTANAGGPYDVDTSAAITGYVKDLENDTGISGASVNITIWNSTFSNSTVKFTNTTGYYSLSRPVDFAGYYNVTVRAQDNNIYGTTDTTYGVKYRVTIPLAPSYNRNSSIAINISVYDRSLVPVIDVAVSSRVSVGGANYLYNGTTDGNGTYSFSFDNTSTMGYYNVTANVTKAGVIGNATGSFRVSSLWIIEYTEKVEYNAGENVTVQGIVKDIEVNNYINNGTYNISIYAPGGIVTSRSGNISYCPGCNFWDEDTFEKGVEWGMRDYYAPVQDSSTAFLSSYSLRMTWPGTNKWGGRNFEGSYGLEAGQTSAGYSTNTYPYMSLAYRISSDDVINMLILVNGAWYSVESDPGEQYRRQLSYKGDMGKSYH